MERYTSRVELTLTAAENKPRGMGWGDFSLERRLGTNLADEAEVRSMSGMIHYLKGDYAQAERVFERELTRNEKAFGPEHPNVALSLHGLGWLYVTQGEYTPAEPLHKRALAIREKALRPDHPDVAQSLNGLGVLYTIQGQYTLAEPLYKRALAIRRRRGGRTILMSRSVGTTWDGSISYKVNTHRPNRSLSGRWR
jgi:tetratricopeptide (TPR) repeat protein